MTRGEVRKMLRRIDKEIAATYGLVKYMWATPHTWRQVLVPDLPCKVGGMPPGRVGALEEEVSPIPIRKKRARSKRRRGKRVGRKRKVRQRTPVAVKASPGIAATGPLGSGRNRGRVPSRKRSEPNPRGHSGPSGTQMAEVNEDPAYRVPKLNSAGRKKRAKQLAEARRRTGD